MKVCTVRPCSIICAISYVDVNLALTENVVTLVDNPSCDHCLVLDQWMLIFVKKISIILLASFNLAVNNIVAYFTRD